MDHFRVADALAALERAGEHILFNPGQVNPVFFPRGGEEALALLRTLREMGRLTRNLGDICPPHLFDFFLAHSLIVPIAPPTPAPGPCHCQSAGGLASARSLYLLLTHACNQACLYCLDGQSTYHEAPTLVMSAAVARDALRTIAESIAVNGRMEVVFFGGEPLLNWPLAKEVIRYCEEELKPAHPGQTFTYHFTTNLTLFPDDLIALARRHAITFLVDIDGPADLHDRIRPLKSSGRHGSSFRKSADHIARLRDAGLEVGLRATVTSHNHHRLLEVTQTHKALGGTGSAFVPLNAVDSDEWIMPLELCPDPALYAQGLRQVYRERIWPVSALFPFSEYLSRLRPDYRSGVACGAPLGNTPVVTADGRIFSCIYLVGIERFTLGDLTRNDFPRPSVMAEMQEIAGRPTRPECADCDFRQLCGGGCPVGKFIIAGNPQATPAIRRYTQDVVCATSKTVLTELLWEQAKVAWSNPSEAS
ncbi:radical SAM protein [uncultured Thiodictyon sp.]|uniref:radical SAM/SPASM domain-containing protein n=1 Tax=uncultured Thiodictyon sp. TaxID=1846217 RepID=UPI0025DDF1DA|nr:radical SAM protein [uncultured Thiodictyon sp.]